MDSVAYTQKAHNRKNSPSQTFTPSVSLPDGHRFFYDCLRENNARFIEWMISRGGFESWFVTETFKDSVSLFGAHRLFRRWAGQLTQGLIDSGGNQLRWILTTELQKRNVIHLHSVVQGRELGSLSRKRWEHRWESLTMNTGFCRIYDADRKAAPYLAKYTSKTLGGELLWGGYWQGLKTPASVGCGHSCESVR